MSTTAFQIEKIDVSIFISRGLGEKKYQKIGPFLEEVISRYKNRNKFKLAHWLRKICPCLVHNFVDLGVILLQLFLVFSRVKRTFSCLTPGSLTDDFTRFFSEITFFHAGICIYKLKFRHVLTSGK